MSKPNTKPQGKKEYAPQVGFWPTKKGTGYSVQITDDVMNMLAKCAIGGRLFLQEVPEDVREQNEKIPHFRVTIFTPDEGYQARTQDNDAV